MHISAPFRKYPERAGAEQRQELLPCEKEVLPPADEFFRLRALLPAAKHREKSERAAHFGRIEKFPVPRNEAGYPLFAKALLDHPQHPVRASEDGDLSERTHLFFPAPAEHIQPADHAGDLFGDKDPFGQFGRAFRHAYRRAAAFYGQKSALAAVRRDRLQGAAEDLRRRTVTLRKAEHGGVGEVCFQPGETLRGRPAEGINGLVRVADDEQFPAARPLAHEFVLYRVHVLKLVDVQPAERFALLPESKGKQVVKIRRARCAQQLAIQGDAFRLLPFSAFIRGNVVQQSPRRTGQPRRRDGLAREFQLQSAFRKRGLSFQHRIADRMEGPDRYFIRALHAGAQPTAHLFGGADGKSDRAYIFRLYALFDEAGDPLGQRKRLTRSRARDHGGHGRFALHRGFLYGVEPPCGAAPPLPVPFPRLFLRFLPFSVYTSAPKP